MTTSTTNRKRRDLLNRIDRSIQAVGARKNGQIKARKVLRDLREIWQLVAALGR